MTPGWQEIVRMPVSVMETGLLAMKAGLRSMQSGVEALSGHRTGARQNDPPIHGSCDLDPAISDFMNHVFRVGRLTRRGAAEIVEGESTWEKVYQPKEPLAGASGEARSSI